MAANEETLDEVGSEDNSKGNPQEQTVEPRPQSAGERRGNKRRGYEVDFDPDALEPSIGLRFNFIS